MAEKDTIRRLRAKAADKATTPEERKALIAKAEELEKRVPGKVITMDAVSKYPNEFVEAWLTKHAVDLDDIVENGYHHNREWEDW